MSPRSFVVRPSRKNGGMNGLHRSGGLARFGLRGSRVVIALCALDLVVLIVEHVGPERWRHALWVVGVALLVAVLSGLVVIWGLVFTRGRLWDRHREARR